jgi:hypothetical protein
MDRGLRGPEFGLCRIALGVLRCAQCLDPLLRVSRGSDRIRERAQDGIETSIARGRDIDMLGDTMVEMDHLGRSELTEAESEIERCPGDYDEVRFLKGMRTRS